MNLLAVIFSCAVTKLYELIDIFHNLGIAKVQSVSSVTCHMKKGSEGRHSVANPWENITQRTRLRFRQIQPILQCNIE